MKRTLSKPLFHLLQMTLMLLAAITFPHGANAQDTAAGSLEDQLKQHYKITKLGLDSGGYSIVDAGTVLVIKKGGILGAPPNNLVLGNTVYKDGEVHSPSPLFLGNATRLLATGEKVYVLKVSANPKNDKVTLLILECDSCNGVNQQSSYKAQVTFQYPKGYLSSADPGQVEDVIAELLAADNNNGGGAQQDQGAQAQAQPAQAEPAAQAPPPAQPETIQLGQTTDQVQAILGQPDKIVNLGSKQIYVYKDIKVTFVNGKVTDAQ